MESEITWLTVNSSDDEGWADFSTLFDPSCKGIENVATEFRVLSVNGIKFPVTINQKEYTSSFVCSPYTAYVHYARDEVKLTIKSRVLRFFLNRLIDCLAIVLKMGKINQNVHVNNFLLSTNPYPIWEGVEIDRITSFLTSAYPNHTIIFRSLNDYQHLDLINRFKNSGYKPIASRQVYIFDGTREFWMTKRNVRSDLKAIAQLGLHYLNHEQMAPYLDQALELYRQLYLHKYSKHNPLFTLGYFRTCHLHQLIVFRGYIDENKQLKAFSGTFSRGNTVTAPLVGYDLSMPQNMALYRHAAQLCFDEYFDKGGVLNLSSGAAGFKKSRGGNPYIEYSMIYTKNQRWNKRITWAILAFFSNKVGVPILKKYGL